MPSSISIVPRSRWSFLNFVPCVRTVLAERQLLFSSNRIKSRISVVASIRVVMPDCPAVGLKDKRPRRLADPEVVFACTGSIKEKRLADPMLLSCRMPSGTPLLFREPCQSMVAVVFSCLALRAKVPRSPVCSGVRRKSVAVSWMLFHGGCSGFSNFWLRNCRLPSSMVSESISK